MSDSENELPTIAQDLVVTKYKMAAEITNGVLSKVCAAAVSGALVKELCKMGDSLLNEETAKVFKRDKEMKKGIAFPTCVSVNNCVCHFSPLRDQAPVTLAEGDMVKVDLGAHIDGFVTVAAHTVVVGASREHPVKGRPADVLLAAHWAAEAALRLVRPGSENSAVTERVQKVAVECFDCRPVEGMLSHKLDQHTIDGEKSIILNPSEQMRSDHEKCEFELHEVYGIDILVSTGEGKARELDTRTTVYKRNDIVYQLKMKTSRHLFSEVERQFGLMAFSLRGFDDEKKAKMGVLECVNHDLLKPFPVLYEKEGELVAQFKYTVLLMPNGPMKITGLPVDLELYQSEHSIQDPELRTLLATSVSRKAAKKKKKKAEKAIVSGAPAAAAADLNSPVTGNGDVTAAEHVTDDVTVRDSVDGVSA